MMCTNIELPWQKGAQNGSFLQKPTFTQKIIYFIVKLTSVV